MMDIAVPETELVRRLDSTDFVLLTNRQREVCIGGIILGGYNPDTLGDFLHISPKTVKNHLAVAFAQLDAISAPQLAVNLLETVTDEGYGAGNVNADLRALGSTPNVVPHFARRQIAVVDATAKLGSAQLAGIELGISPKTVKNHLADVYNKVQEVGRVENRHLTGAYLLMRKLDLLPMGVVPIAAEESEVIAELGENEYYTADSDLHHEAIAVY